MLLRFCSFYRITSKNPRNRVSLICKVIVYHKQQHTTTKSKNFITKFKLHSISRESRVNYSKHVKANSEIFFIYLDNIGKIAQTSRHYFAKLLHSTSLAKKSANRSTTTADTEQENFKLTELRFK